jgi:hypothetical protein
MMISVLPEDCVIIGVNLVFIAQSICFLVLKKIVTRLFLIAQISQYKATSKKDIGFWEETQLLWVVFMPLLTLSNPEQGRNSSVLKNLSFSQFSILVSI